jgi:hypothetical protein
MVTVIWKQKVTWKQKVMVKERQNWTGSDLDLLKPAHADLRWYNEAYRYPT